MTKDLRSLIDATSPLSADCPIETGGRRRHCGASSLQANRRAGDLPSPSGADTEKLAQPPKRGIFSQSVLFGKRFMGLISTQETTEPAGPQGCSFPKQGSCENLRRRLKQHSPDPSPEDSFGNSVPDNISDKLAGVGISLIAFFAAAVLIIAVPGKASKSHSVSRQPLPAAPVPAAAPASQPESLAGGPAIDDVDID